MRTIFIGVVLAATVLAGIVAAKKDRFEFLKDETSRPAVGPVVSVLKDTADGRCFLVLQQYNGTNGMNGSYAIAVGPVVPCEH